MRCSSSNSGEAFLFGHRISPLKVPHGVPVQAGAGAVLVVELFEGNCGGIGAVISHRHRGRARLSQGRR